MLVLVGAWALLDLLFNARYPAPGAIGPSLLPSLDATVVLAVAALCAATGRRLPAAIVVATGVLGVATRLFRLGDGVTLRYFNRPLSLGLDVPLTSELVRLLDATLPRAALVAGVVLVAGLFAGVAALAARALRAAERALAQPAPRAAFAGIAALGALASLALPPARDDRRLGAFAPSVLPRLAREFAFAARIDRYRDERAAAIAGAAARIQALPHGLQKLGGQDVLLFFIESYGATALDDPAQAATLEPTYRAATDELQRGGFLVASGLLDSPTYAGRSWLAHQTLLTGVRSDDRVADELVQQARPATLAGLLRADGYRTLFAQPANRYPSLSRWIYDFDAVLSSWDLGYRGPGYRWANMPDQFVLDFVHRHQIAPRATPPGPPLFVAYALVSSHAPWSDQPRFVDDWSRIGDGAIYGTLPTDHFPITWTTLADAGPAYAQSVAYDLRVIADYLVRFVAGDALIIILGDHQPAAEVTRFSASHAVPIHIISRRRAFIEPFLARGYQAALRPRRGDRPPPGMETFLPDLLADFSAAPGR